MREIIDLNRKDGLTLEVERLADDVWVHFPAPFADEVQRASQSGTQPYAWRVPAALISAITDG